MKTRSWLFISAALIIIIGVARTIGGFVLLIGGRSLDTEHLIIATDLEVVVVVIGLLMIGVFLIFSALYMLRKFSYQSWKLCWIAISLFILTGLLNGVFLFGTPIEQGQIINLVSTILVASLLLLGKKGLNKK